MGNRAREKLERGKNKAWKCTTREKLEDGKKRGEGGNRKREKEEGGGENRYGENRQREREGHLLCWAGLRFV